MVAVLFFAPDLSETAQLRRIRSIRKAGHSVASISTQKSEVEVDWPNHNLGQISNERMGRRIWLALQGLVKLWRNKIPMPEADLIIARNIDMVILAMAFQKISGRRMPIIYECLDINGIFTRPGIKSYIVRKIEKFALKRIQLLIVSSTGFIDSYFGTLQKYSGRWLLVENKIWFPYRPLPREAMNIARTGPFVLGWVGAIRCRPTLNLLCKVAELMGDSIKIEIRGIIHDHALQDFAARIKEHTNINYGGPFHNPDGLREVYGAIDLVWAQDLWQGGSNSDWLLPNRIYEASWFGCPSIAVAGTQTANKVAKDRLGFVIESATHDALIRLLSSLSRQEIRDAGQKILLRPDSDFAQTEFDINSIIKLGMQN